MPCCPAWNNLISVATVVGFKIASRLASATEGQDNRCLNGKILDLKLPVVHMKKRHVVQKLGTLTYALCQRAFWMGGRKTSQGCKISLPCLSPLFKIQRVASLVAQWLRCHTSTATRHRLNPWARKIPHAEEQLSPWATSATSEACSPRANVREATTVRSPRTTGEYIPLATTRQSCSSVQQRRPSEGRK